MTEIIMARVVHVGGATGPRVVGLRGSKRPHERCDPRSWCQPVEISLAAQRADLAKKP